MTYTLSDSGLLTISGSGAIYDFDYYKDSSTTTTSSSPFQYRTDIKQIVICEGITTIGRYAFRGCHNVTSVAISANVTSIHYAAFNGCTSLPSIDIPSSVTGIGESAFYGCRSLTSLYIPSSVTTIGETAFKDCKDIAYIRIESGVNKIKENAFDGCYLVKSKLDNRSSLDLTSSGLTIVDTEQEDGLMIKDSVVVNCRTKATSVAIPSSITCFKNCAFEYCENLSSVTIPSSVTSIGDYAFHDCTSLTSINIPESVTSIGSYAFYNCLSLTSVTIPSSMTSIGGNAFSECPSLTLWDYSSLESYRYCNNIYSIYTNPSKFPYLTGVKYLHSLMKHYFTIENTLLYGLSYCMKEETDELIPESAIKSLTLTSKDSGETSSIETSEDSQLQLVKNLKNGYTYTMTLTTENGQVESIDFTTKKGTVSATATVSGTTITIDFNGDSDESGSWTSLSAYCSGTTTETETSKIVYDGLKPNKKYTFTPYAYYGERKITGDQITATTENFKLNQSYSASPTTIDCNFTLNTYSTEVTSITVDEKECKGNKFSGTGLEPNKTYYFELKAYDNSDLLYTGYIYGTTTALVLTTEAPKVISEGNVIVAATSNITDEDEQVGFEWRRTDWTDDFASNTGAAALYDGELEGYIRNLNTNYLFKYRPYYLSNSGTYYYGDWVGIDPTNTSYFEPTVHTYDKITIEGNTALVKGYALTGTDGIKVQGFKYWKSTSRNAKGLAAAPADATTVEASGQVMETTLTGLAYNSEYTYQAFVTTKEGDTFYGEERTFQTGDDPAGIEDISVDDSESAREISGYFDLSGRCINGPQRGFYIIRYSDGTSVKVLKK